MQIQVARIPEEGLDLAGEDSEVIAASDIEQGWAVKGPVRYKFHAAYVSGELIVYGALSLGMSVPCSRCAATTDIEVAEKSFEGVFEAPDGNESVDLTAEMRDAILCAFPSHPLCRSDCKGLCVRCGKDLNEGECGCSAGPGGGWAGLNGLKL